MCTYIYRILSEEIRFVLPDAFCSIIPPTFEQDVVVASARNIRQMPGCEESRSSTFARDVTLFFHFEASRSEQSTLIVDAGNERSVAKRILEIKQNSTCDGRKNSIAKL